MYLFVFNIQVVIENNLSIVKVHLQGLGVSNDRSMVACIYAESMDVNSNPLSFR